MKKLLFAAILFISAPAMAEEAAAPAATATATSTDQDKFYPLNDSDRPLSFEERKAKLLKHVDERIVALQKKQACIKIAKNPEAMKTCLPNRGKLHPMMEKRRERMEERGGMMK